MSCCYKIPLFCSLACIFLPALSPDEVVHPLRDLDGVAGERLAVPDPVDSRDPEPVLQPRHTGHTQGVILGVATSAPRVLLTVHLLKLRIGNDEFQYRQNDTQDIPDNVPGERRHRP